MVPVIHQSRELWTQIYG